MHGCMCMYVCVHVCVYVYIYKYMYYSIIYVCVFVCIYIYGYVYVYIYIVTTSTIPQTTEPSAYKSLPRREQHCIYLPNLPKPLMSWDVHCLSYCMGHNRG